MATDRLKIYNGALRLIGERSLASLDEDREPRRLLDEVWNDGGARYCLERGQWKFAMRAARLDYSTDVTPEWGYRWAFEKPTDWVDTSAVCSDEYFRVPLTQYSDEVGFWCCDLDQIWVKYVSDDEDFGGNLANWPYSFTDYVKAYFAGEVAMKLAASDKTIIFLNGNPTKNESGIIARRLVTAKNRDAMAGPTTFPAQGSWSASRQGRMNGRRSWNDGGNRGSLIG